VFRYAYERVTETGVLVKEIENEKQPPAYSKNQFLYQTISIDTQMVKRKMKHF